MGCCQVREPQMPKGVEHMGNLGGRPVKLKVREPQMPKGVEHIVAVCPAPVESFQCENLRCRKALSTLTTGSFLIGCPTVREPQMPKGVEHMAKITKDIGRATGIPNFSCYRGRHRMIAGHTKAETTLAYASRRALRALTGREVRNFQRRSFEPPQPPATTETGATVVVNLLAGSETIDAGTGI